MGQELARADSKTPRRSERRTVTLRGFLVLPDGRASEVTVLDLSYEGCRAVTDARLAHGDKVKLAVLERGAIDAWVRWADNGKAGLVFEPIEDPEKDFVARRSERTRIAAEVSMRRIGRFPFQVRAFDISPEGCKAEFVDRPDPAEQMWIKFDGLESIHANVRWIRGVRVGLEFARPIHRAVFELLLARLG